MIGKIQHRGPDRQDVWCHRNVGLGNALLKTTPESCFEELPYTDQKYKLTITADARIDNRDELFEKLSLINNKKVPDSYLILEAYKKWGEGCAQYLLGDFSFVIWDDDNKKLICCRDYLGHRPFFYYNDEKSFIFASEIKGLRALTEVPLAINDERVADYLQLIVGNGEYTFYQDIYRLEPATILTIADGQIQKKKYFSFESIESNIHCKKNECTEELRDKLFQAVDCRIRTNARVGCQFSGGLDSSSVACIARKSLPKDINLYTYSATYETINHQYLKKINEKEFQDSITKFEGYAPHSFDASMMSPLADTDMYLDMMDEPVYFPNIYMSNECYRLAHQNNIRIMLDGADGDSVVSHGFENFTQLFLTGRFLKLINQVIWRGKILGRGKLSSLRQYIIRPFFRAPAAYLWHKYKCIAFPNWNINKLIAPDFAIDANLLDRIQPKWPIQNPNTFHQERMNSPLHALALENKNILSSYYGIETRSPFYDRRVVQYCISLPSNQKLHNGVTRYILREAVRGIVPEKNRTRNDKANLGIGFCFNLVSKDKDRINTSFANLHPYLKARINVPHLQQNWSLLKADPYGAGQQSLIHNNVYTVYMLNAWLHKIKPMSGDFN
jgi:asparagine synthase (glutamine-hydrolysing)